jgi:hypothetical protein
LKESAIKRWLSFPTGYFWFSLTGRDVSLRVAVGRSKGEGATGAAGEALEPEAIPEEGRQSHDYLKRHVEMWTNGEAEKLVDNKIARGNDAARRIAPRARQEQDDGKDIDNSTAEDGDK